MKENNQNNKKNLNTTDYNGELIWMGKLDHKNYLSHYVQMDVNIIQEEEIRKKSKKIEK